jgi:Protein of unknown function (DUF3014)
MDDRQPPTSLKHNRSPLLAIIVLIALGVAGWFAWRTLQPPEARVDLPAQPVAVAPQPEDAGPTASLEEGDALLKTLAKTLSTDETFSSWLKAPLLRNLAAATQMVAEGESPRPALPFLQLSGDYQVREQEQPKPKNKRQPRPPPKLFVSPASWARFDGLVRGFTSIDAAAAGDAWGRLHPYFDAAFIEIGKPGQRFEDVLTLALKRLLAVQFPEGEVELTAKGAVYLFSDPTLEALSPAEKQLLRLGPTNGRAVQAKLRTFAEHAHLSL